MGERFSGRRNKIYVFWISDSWLSMGSWPCILWLDGASLASWPEQFSYVRDFNSRHTWSSFQNNMKKIKSLNIWGWVVLEFEFGKHVMTCHLLHLTPLSVNNHDFCYLHIQSSWKKKKKTLFCYSLLVLPPCFLQFTKRIHFLNDLFKLLIFCKSFKRILKEAHSFIFVLLGSILGWTLSVANPPGDLLSIFFLQLGVVSLRMYTRLPFNHQAHPTFYNWVYIWYMIEAG